MLLARNSRLISWLKDWFQKHFKSQARKDLESHERLLRALDRCTELLMELREVADDYHKRERARSEAQKESAQTIQSGKDQPREGPGSNQEEQKKRLDFSEWDLDA